MSRPAQRKVTATTSRDALAGQVEGLLRSEKFKEAIELLKQLVKQDPSPQWREALAGAYLGRARALAEKGMFKEAEIVLGNAAGPDGTVKDPMLLLRCLIRQGQLQKALSCALKHANSFESDANLAELAAALFLAFPTKLDPPGDGATPRARWIEAAIAAREALGAWVDNKCDAEVDALLVKIPLRSSFKAVRLILKSLLLSRSDAVKARRLLEGVALNSPFASLRRAAEAAARDEPAELAAKWSGLTRAQQAFAIEASGAPEQSARTLIRLFEAERAGPSALFGFLLKQTGQLAAYTRSASLNLLPRAPDRIAQFEKAFGPLAESEKQRILAIAAQESAKWSRAERHWRAAAAEFEIEGTAQAKLSAGVIYRHLADLASRLPEIGRGDFSLDPRTDYLKKSLEWDPDHLPAQLRLIDLLSEGDDEDRKEWHAQTEAAVRRFPKESAVLLRAIDSAAARKAYKKAAGFAQKLLELDPINQPARQRMIDLQIAHARKQLRGKRADLAARELSDALQWERANQPNPALRINLALVELCGGGGAAAQARLCETVELAGGGAIGWFRAAIEQALLAPPKNAGASFVRDELTKTMRRTPEKREIVAIVAAMGTSDVKAAAKAADEVARNLSLWLRKAAAVLHFSTAEFHPLAELLLRIQDFDLLGGLAKLARRREPKEPVWRFYEIVARTRNNPDAMYRSESDEIDNMIGRELNPSDFHWQNRIRRYLESSGDDPAAKRRAKRLAEDERAFDEIEMTAALEEILKVVSPLDVRRTIKARGKEGAAVALLARLVKSPVGRGLSGPALIRIVHLLIEMVEADPASPF